MWCSVPDRSPQGLLDATLCCRLAQISVFLLLALLPFLFSVFVFFSLVLPLGVLCSLSLFMALELVDLMIAHFLFHPRPIAYCFSLGFPISTSSSVAHKEWPLILLWIAPTLLRWFGFSITLWNESSVSVVVKSNVKILSTCLNPLLNLVAPSGVISTMRYRAPKSNDIHSFLAVDLLDH